MSRTFAGIWLAAVLLAVAGMLGLSFLDKVAGTKATRHSFPSLQGADIVFIGSSLAGIAIPPHKPAHGILLDERSSEVISANGISEQLSNLLLGYAIDSGVELIFLEINAYAHDYADPTEPIWLSSFEADIRRLGTRQRDSFKVLIRSDQGAINAVRRGAPTPRKTLDAAKLQRRYLYYFRTFEPSRGDELRALLARAREAGVEVYFFSPPRPELLVNSLDDGAYEALLAHVREIAAAYDTPLWYSDSAWPDNHFADIMAHTNARGRKRFQVELARWYKARR